MGVAATRSFSTDRHRPRWGASAAGSVRVMTIELSHPEFHASVAEVRRTASALTSTRARAAGEVADLLDCWRGSAAEAFAEAWTDWRVAAEAVG